jgi:hypothetical protein
LKSLFMRLCELSDDICIRLDSEITNITEIRTNVFLATDNRNPQEETVSYLVSCVHAQLR